MEKYINCVGLSDLDVLESRKKYGTNQIPDSEPTTFWNEFKETFSDPMIRILLVITGIMFVMFFFGKTEIYEPVGTIVAVLIVAFVSAKTGVASDVAYRDLKSKQKKEICKVFRNNLICVINIDDVVVGDMVLLQSGDKVPADGYLVDGMIKVDNSALNGESEECEKTAITTMQPFPNEITGETFVDASSLFRGAILFDGEGILEVKKVGLSTMMGKMAQEMEGDEPDSPLKLKLGILANQISKFGYFGAIIIIVCYMIFFIINAGGISQYLAIGWGNILKYVIEAISLAVVIIVCAVPEGLPLMISLVLMQNTKKMLEHNVLVRKAIGIETAGSLNILFSDKTGTITKGKLEVVEYFTADGKSIPINKIKDLGKIHMLTNIAIGLNTASMYDNNHNIVGGNATDQALARFIGEENYKLLLNNNFYKIETSQSFNSNNKFSQVEIKDLHQTFYNGAAEKIIDAASKGLNANGDIINIDKIKINNTINELASRSMRVLAFGYSNKKLVSNLINDDLIVIGFIAIRDDVRTEAKEAIDEVKKAGIQVVMITGDRYETAVSIAKDSGLMINDEDIAITSSEFSKMSDDELKSKIKNIRVIARALPTDKSRMVRICQEMNLVVGMTGDGVNDTPALKKADVGFAMGSGTEAAKEASEIVILDDNFKSIKDAIWYGRTIYNNILKFCKFQLVINVAAVVVSAMSPFFGIEEPLKVTHLLFINLVMDGLGAIMLGNEPALKQYMDEKPRRRDENIISSSMFLQIIISGFWLVTISFIFLKSPLILQIFDNDLGKLYSAFFVLFVVTALFNGFNVRDEGFRIFANLDKNPSFIKVWIAIVLVQLLIVYAALIPLPIFKFIGQMFSCVPFSLKGLVFTIMLAFLIIPTDLLRKIIFINKQ